MDYGALGTGGGLIGGVTSFYQPFISQNWAANAARKQRHWAEWMAVNQYSLAVRGLRKAGLNPILAATQGPGGSPGYQARSAEFDADSDAIGRGVTTALSAMTARENLELLRKENELKAKDVEIRDIDKRIRAVDEMIANESFHGVVGDVATKRATAKITENERDISNATKATAIGRQITELELMRAKLPSAKAQAEFDQSEAGQTLNYLRRAVDVVRPGGSR